MLESDDRLLSGEKARLIPVVSDGSREVRAASILLATITAVPPFARAMLGSLGQRVGVRTDVDCYTEAVFKNCPEGGKLRPDGFIVLDTGGGRSWSCLVEAKIGRAELDAGQITKYAALAKANAVPAIVTISNQFSALPTHPPVRLSRTSARGIEIFHWSWMYVLTEAMLLLNDDPFERPEQRYILAEMVRYFTHDSVGVSTFDRMNPEWKDLVLKVQAGAPLLRNSPEIENSVAAWHQESRDMCLLLSRRLNRHVKLRLSRAHADDPIERLKDDADTLVKTHEIGCVLDVPDAAAPIAVSANLQRRSLSVSMTLAAPKDRQQSRSRINWIVRQLAKADPTGIHVKAKWPGRMPDTQATLADLRLNPQILEAANKALPQHFEVMLVRDLAGKFSGTRTFLEEVERTVPSFYQQVGQYLRAYVPTPPKLRREAASDEEVTEKEEMARETETDSSEAADDTAAADGAQVRGESNPLESWPAPQASDRHLPHTSSDDDTSGDQRIADTGV